MAIEMRLCECGCGKSKPGTARLQYFSKACKTRVWRRNKKKDNPDKA